jgi:hypothetical protein
MLLLYRVYLKYLYKPQELVLHINTEKRKFKHMSRNDWFLRLIGRINTTINIFAMFHVTNYIIQLQYTLPL